MNDGGAEALRQELSGANRLAEFRLQKVIELKSEVARLRRLLLSVRGGSGALQRANSRKASGGGSLSAAVPRRSQNGKSPSLSPSTTTTGGGAVSKRGGRRALSSPSPCPSATTAVLPTTTTAATVTVGTHMAPSRPRALSSVATGVRGVSRSVSRRSQQSSAPRCDSGQPSSPQVLTPSTKARPKVVTQPCIKLHTGVKLRGPKTFPRLPPQLLESPCVTEDVYSASVSTVVMDGSSAGAIIPPSSRLCSSFLIRQEYENVRETLAMLRGIVLRADRNMLSVLTMLSNRRNIDHALPTALAEFKQCLLRAHPSLGDKLHDGEVWAIDECERDALEVTEVPGMAATLRNLVITYDYTACSNQQLLSQDEGMIPIRLGKSFHEFYANMYVFLTLAQCPAVLR